LGLGAGAGYCYIDSVTMSSDWIDSVGIKISKPGIDVGSGNDDDMLMTTKFSLPKIVNNEELDMDTVGNPYEYPHRAEVVPFVLIYSTAEGHTDKVMANYMNYNDPDLVEIWVSVNENIIRIMTNHLLEPEIQVYTIIPEIDI